MDKEKVLIITDNGYIYLRLKNIILENFSDLSSIIEYGRSKLSSKEKLYVHGIESLQEIDVKNDYLSLIQNYKLIISLHCKQIFPHELVKNTRCINVHPGYNPYNRGWYPQVFAIINKTKIGATIHVMDQQIDHGNIIARKELTINKWDTSKEVYEKVLDTEIELINNNLRDIISGNYKTIVPEFEGEYHSLNDYKNLCKIDLKELLTMEQAIDKLRALSHGEYKNSFFYDDKGNKIFVKIELSRE